MEIRLNELIEAAKCFILQEDIFRNLTCAVLIIVLYFTYLIFMYLKSKTRYKRFTRIAYIIVGAFIMLTAIMVLGMSVEMVIPIIMCIILDIKIALT